MKSYDTKLGVKTVDYHAKDTKTPQALDSHGRDDHPTPNQGKSREVASSPHPSLIRRRLSEEKERRGGEKIYLILNHFRYPCHLLPSTYDQYGSTTEN